MEGKKLVQDVRDIIKTAGLMVEQKNADELFQVRFIVYFLLSACL